jgi:hypothetical protein
MTFVYKNEDEPDNESDIAWFDYIFKFNICLVCYGFIQQYFS